MAYNEEYAKYAEIFELSLKAITKQFKMINKKMKEFEKKKKSVNRKINSGIKRTDGLSL